MSSRSQRTVSFENGFRVRTLSGSYVLERWFGCHGFQGDSGGVALPFPLSKKLKEGVNVFAERFDQLFSHRAGLFNDRVGPHSYTPSKVTDDTRFEIDPGLTYTPYSRFSN